MESSLMNGAWELVPGTGGGGRYRGAPPGRVRCTLCNVFADDRAVCRSAHESGWKHKEAVRAAEVRSRAQARERARADDLAAREFARVTGAPPPQRQQQPPPPQQQQQHSRPQPSASYLLPSRSPFGSTSSIQSSSESVIGAWIVVDRLRPAVADMDRAPSSVLSDRLSADDESTVIRQLRRPRSETDSRNVDVDAARKRPRAIEGSVPGPSPTVFPLLSLRRPRSVLSSNAFDEL